MELSATEHDAGTNSGVYLPQILPDGSLGNMQVPVGSVLQQINDVPVASIPEVFAALASIREGDALTVVVYEQDARKTYKGVAVGKALEQHQHASVEYGEVQYADNILRSLLYLPTGVEQPPVIFFLQGYTCQSIEMRPNNPGKQLIDAWIQEGYAVFLVEKPGMGDSECGTPCMEIDFNQELEAFSNAYASLRATTSIDRNNIFLFGHSMGGIIAPLLAREHQPAGVMVYGIVGKNWHDYMVDIFTEQPLLLGDTEQQIQEESQFTLPFIKDMLIHKKSNLELIASPVYGDFLKAEGTAESLAEGYYIQRHYTYWQALADVDVPEVWSGVKAPVLVLHGEYDIQAIAPKYGEMIAANVNAHGGNAQFKLFPKTEHAFLKFDSREDLRSTMNNGSYGSTFETHFNRAIVTKSMEWMAQQTVKP